METNKIYQMDCLEFMRSLPDGCVDLIVTSPPYNKSRTFSSERALLNHEIHYKDFDDAKTNEEYLAWTLERFKEFGRILKDNRVVCYNLSYSTDEIRMAELMWLVVADVIRQGVFTLADAIVWKKKNAMPNNRSMNKMTRICEFVFVFCKRKDFDTFHANKKILSVTTKGQANYENHYNYIEAVNNDGPCDIHKAAYSTSLCYQLIERYGTRGGVVYDPFMGTGTTALAAIEQKMGYIGTEISAEYCEYARERIKMETAQLSLF